MTYHPLSQDSGQTPERRSQEACEILGMLKGASVPLEPGEIKFIADLTSNFQRYGARTMVSTKQLFWLRDIKERVL